MRRQDKLQNAIARICELSHAINMLMPNSNTITASPTDAMYADEKTPVAQTTTDMYFTKGKTIWTDTAIGESTPLKRSAFRWNLLRNPLLLLYAITLSLCDSSYGNVYMFMPPHATMAGFSSSNAALLISVIGITQAVSRLVVGCVADLNIFDKKHIYQCAMFVCGATFCVMPFIRSYVLLAAVSVVCSLSAGSFVVLSAVLIAESLGTENLPTTYGVLYSTESFFFLASPVFMGEQRLVFSQPIVHFYLMNTFVRVYVSLHRLFDLVN